MGQDKTELVHLLNFVKQIYANPKNKEFAAGIQAMVLDGDMDIKQDINDIRVALQIRGKNSLSYSFVKDDIVRTQLLVDNLRMENAILNLSMSDDERYNTFCINAFLQVENLLNYFYVSSLDGILDIVCEVENATQGQKYPFKRSGYEKRVSDIPSAKKLLAFCLTYFPYASDTPDFTYHKLKQLANIRNSNFHRGGTKEDLSVDEKLTYYSLDEFRGVLIDLAEKIEELLSY